MAQTPSVMADYQGYDALGASARRILDVAERLAAERGLEAVSMRDVAREAQISLSVIYHHFGSKGSLLRWVLRRRMEELVELRRALFDDRDPDGAPDLDQLLHAIIAPIALLRRRGAEGAITVQFLAQALLSTQPEIRDEIERNIGDFAALVDLMRQVVPNLSREEVCWRLHFTIGISRMTHRDSDRLAVMSRGTCDGNDVDQSIARAVAYARAAFLAP